MARPLILALALSAPFVTVACGGSSPQRSTTPRSGSGSASSLLADAPSPLAGDTLRARLPRGTVAPTGPTEAVPGELVRTVHVVTRPTGDLRITAVDTAKNVGDDFATTILAQEGRARCADETVTITPATTTAAPAGLGVVVFTPETACEGQTPPAARIWVKAPDTSLLSVTLECVADGCLPDRQAVLDAFIGSFAAGTPTAAPAGPRTFGPAEGISVTVTVPEGYLLRRSSGEGSAMFEVFRRRALGAPGEGVSFSFLAEPSAGSVRDDYAREGARVRNVNATIGGHRVRVVELKYPTSTERIARTTLGGQQLDVVIVGATDAGLAELEALVTGATLTGAH